MAIASPGRQAAARAAQMRTLLNQAVAIETELLSAAVQVWTTMFESMAAYTKAVSEEIVGFSARGDANESLDNVLKVAKRRLDQLEKLPDRIGSEFARKVRARSKA